MSDKDTLKRRIARRDARIKQLEAALERIAGMWSDQAEMNAADLARQALEARPGSPSDG